METPFEDRVEAGHELATRLKYYANRPHVMVLGLPRGGVEVAAEVARELRLPMDIFIVRKLGVPNRPELAMGAIASGGLGVLNTDVIHALGISNATIDEIASEEYQELERRENLYRNGRPAPAVSGRTVILVDDGLATGATMRAAVAALRQQNPRRIIVAVPVGEPEICAEFEQKADEVICARTPHTLLAVGLWYRHFPQLTDEDVRELHRQTNEETHHISTNGDERY